MPATRITWRDVLAMPEDGRIYEAIGGELFVSPPPKTRHEWVSMNLVNELLPLLVHPGHGRLFTAPIGVEFPETEEGVQPDIVFVTTERLGVVKEDAIQGAPDLVIEILSPSTARRDRTVKLDLYRSQGVAEYWIVDIDAKQIETWYLATGATEAERYTDRVPVRLGNRRLGVIELDKVFEGNW